MNEYLEEMVSHMWINSPDVTEWCKARQEEEEAWDLALWEESGS